MHMADTNKPAQGKNQAQNSNSGANSSAAEKFTSIPAIRHVGPTLESDPHYFDVEREGGGETPEAQIMKEGTSTASHVGRGATDVSADISGSPGGANRGGRNEQPEPLKTRLPGDTSSDPHTDLGPDNATNLQSRGEGTRE
jgi:hypothetical protein